MNIRQEVESAVAAFANSQTPQIPIAFEGVPFTKPTNGPYLEVFFLANSPMNATVDVSRIRVYGTFQINCYVLDGKGMKALDDLSDSIVALFPVNNKGLYTTFSVEQPPNVSPPLSDTKFRMAAVRVKYRQEL
jgi:hypothetical protein